jgi:hypothetical protein
MLIVVRQLNHMEWSDNLYEYKKIRYQMIIYIFMKG